MAESASRIAVTGIGIASPIGIGRAAFWRALVAGESGVRAIKDGGGPADTRGLPRQEARLPEFDWRRWIDSPLARRMDDLSRRIVATGRMALDDAGLSVSSVAGDRLGMVVGSAFGNLVGSVDYLEKVFVKGPGLASPMLFPTLVHNAPASHLAMEIGATGPNLTVSQLEASGDLAIAQGCDLLRERRADVVIAGGGDEWAEALVVAYRGTRALAGQRGGVEWSSPYDRDRSGVVLGEGAALVVLERAADAAARGARVYAEVVADTFFGMAAPPFDWPAEPGIASARLREWLTATTAPVVDLVCGSANSSPVLDACESRLLEEVFGGAAGRMVLTSIKGAVGEWGAAGAMTFATACLALQAGVVPPLCHLQSPAWDSGLPLAGRVGEPRPLRAAMTVAIARGGTLCALLLSRPD